MICVVLLALLAAAEPPVDSSDPPPDPPATTEWHKEPVLEKAAGKNIVVYNHADPSFEIATILSLLQTQYDFLREYTGWAPRWIQVHVGNKYKMGFMIRNGPHPEMFLQAASIFDTQANYAHEMMHCFMCELGQLPHWFNESMSDIAWIDSEIELWKRRKAEPFLKTMDRIDHRSYELIQLRTIHGRELFRKTCAALLRRREECRKTFQASEKLEAKNLLILSALSEAAGADVTAQFEEWGFKTRTRERQRGY